MISFFVDRDAYYKTSYGHAHLHRGSSLIRGKQIADYLGAKYRPKSGYENDVCIYVKPWSLDTVRNGWYADVVDMSPKFFRRFSERPDIFIIVLTEDSREYFTRRFKNKVIVIPQHHCNFNNDIRVTDRIKTVGIIGIKWYWSQENLDMVQKVVEELDLSFMSCFDYSSREDVVNFYKDMDIQIVWNTTRSPLVNPLKIVNGASFGIPTIGFPQRGYKETGDLFTPAVDYSSLRSAIKRMLDDTVYFSELKFRLIEFSKPYHISKIAELYRELDK